MVSLSQAVGVATLVVGCATVVNIVFTLWLGFTTRRIQRQQADIQQRQAETTARQFRFALLEKRMVVYDSLTKFLATTVQKAKVDLPETFAMLRATSDQEFLFGADVNEFIDRVFKQATKLNAQRDAPYEDRKFAEETETLMWFYNQMEAAKQVFLPYIDFREP